MNEVETREDETQTADRPKRGIDKGTLMLAGGLLLGLVLLIVFNMN